MTRRPASPATCYLLIVTCLLGMSGCQSPQSTVGPASDSIQLARQLRQTLGDDWHVIPIGNRISILSRRYLMWHAHSSGDFSFGESDYPWQDYHFQPMEVELEVRPFVSEGDYLAERKRNSERLDFLIKHMEQLGVPSFKGRFLEPETELGKEPYNAYKIEMSKALDRPTHHNGRLTVRIKQLPTGWWLTPIDVDQMMGSKDGDSALMNALSGETTGQPVTEQKIGYTNPLQFEKDFWIKLESVLTPYPKEN